MMFVSGGSQPGYNLKYSKNSTIMPTKEMLDEKKITQKGVDDREYKTGRIHV
jgi:hypothetical protein